MAHGGRGMEHYRPPGGGALTRGRMLRRVVVYSMKTRRKAWAGREDRTPLTARDKRLLRNYARALTRRTERGKVYGILTAKQVEVYLWIMDVRHNGATGECFPSYADIRFGVRCCNETVSEALQALEAAGMMFRIRRVERRVLGDAEGLNGIEEPLVRQTSNAYVFTRPELLHAPELLVCQRDHVPMNRAQPMNSAAKLKAEGLRSPSRPDNSGSQRETAPNPLPIQFLPSGRIILSPELVAALPNRIRFQSRERLSDEQDRKLSG